MIDILPLVLPVSIITACETAKAHCFVSSVYHISQKKKYERVKTMDDDEEDDDEKDLIADEIFHGDGEGDLEEGEAIDEPLPRGDDDEEGEDEESGKMKGFCCREV